MAADFGALQLLSLLSRGKKSKADDTEDVGAMCNLLLLSPSKRLPKRLEAIENWLDIAGFEND